jgi:hypothetical protein
LTDDERRSREFDAVRSALAAVGLPSADFGRFTANRHPDVVRPSVFDYRGAVPVLLEMLPKVSHPDVLESIVRSLSTPYARPGAALPLIELFRKTSDDAGLKWAIGNALSVVTTPAHKEALVELALNEKHGRGRQMIIERLGRIDGDPGIVEALHRLAIDPEVALHAQAGLRRRLGQFEALQIIRPLLGHSSEGVRRAAVYNVRKAEQALKRSGRTLIK